jgi:hypothetical protein
MGLCEALTHFRLMAGRYVSIISSGILIGYAGFWRLYPDRRLRGIGAAAFLCVGIADARVADEYLFQIPPLIACRVPNFCVLAGCRVNKSENK